MLPDELDWLQNSASKKSEKPQILPSYCIAFLENLILVHPLLNRYLMRHISLMDAEK